MRRVATLLSCVLLAGTLVGCGGEDDPPGSADGLSTSESRAGAQKALRGDSGYSVLGALDLLPGVARGDARVEVLSGSLEAATALARTKRPTDKDPEQLVPWLRALNGDVAVPDTQSTGLNSVNIDPTGKALGFTAADVRSFAELRSGRTRFSVQTLYADATVRKDLPKRAGLQQTSAGRPGRPTRDRSVFAQFPVVNLLAESDGRVAFSTDARAVQRWKTGTGPRLGKDSELGAVARVLDDADVYAASLVRGSFASRGRPPKAAVRERFTAVGVGFTLERNKPVVHVSYYVPGDAAAAARQVQAAWKDGTSRRGNVPLTDYVTLLDTERSGRVVTVRLDASRTGPQVVQQMLVAGDTPFVVR